MGKRPDLVALVHLALGQHEAHGALHMDDAECYVAWDDNKSTTVATQVNTARKTVRHVTMRTSKGPRNRDGCCCRLNCCRLVAAAAGWCGKGEIQRTVPDNNRPFLAY